MRLVETLVKYKDELAQLNRDICFKIGRDVLRTVHRTSSHAIFYKRTGSVHEYDLGIESRMAISGISVGSRLVKSPLVFLVR